MSKSKKRRRAEQLARILGVQDPYRKPKFQPNRKPRSDEIQEIFADVMSNDSEFQVQFIKGSSDQ